MTDAEDGARDRLTEADLMTRQHNFCSLGQVLLMQLVSAVSDFAPPGFRIALVLFDADVAGMATAGTGALPPGADPWGRLSEVLRECAHDADTMSSPVTTVVLRTKEPHDA